MISATIKGFKNAASKITNQTRSAARRREPRLSSIQMFTTDSDRPTPMKHVVLNQELASLLADARTLRAEKAEEYKRMDRAVEDLKDEKDELLQEIKDLKEEITDALGLDDYKFLRAFCRGKVKSESFQERFGYPPNEIEDDSIAVCISSMEDLLQKEKSLEVKEQQILADTARLAKTQDIVDDHQAEVRRLSDLISRTEPQHFLSVTSHRLPNVQDSPKIRQSNTDISNLHNYPTSPAKVRSLLVKSFVDYCNEKGYIDILNELQSTVNFKDVFERLVKIKEFSNEATVTTAFDQVMSLVTEAMTQESNEKVPYKVSIYTDDPKNIEGRADFTFAAKTVDGIHIPLIVGEFKGPGKNYSYDNLSETYCDHGCTGCGSDRHKKYSVVRQLYNYMFLNGLLVGVYSNYKVTCVLIRDCEGNLMITKSVRAEDVGDIARGKLSTMQLVALAILLAADTSEMNFSVIENSILVPCLGGPGQTPERVVLPAVWKASNDAKIENHENQNSADPKHFRKDGASIHLPLLKLDGYTELPPGRTGRTLRIGIPLPTGERIDSVLKILDSFKQEEQIPELENEAEIYKQLKSLQGEHIPEFIDYGLFECDVLYGLGTKYSGEPLTPEDITDDFVEKAVIALDEIHSQGVLHGDVDARNVLYNKETQRPVIVDFGIAVRKMEMSDEYFARAADQEINELRHSLGKVRGVKN